MKRWYIIGVYAILFCACSKKKELVRTSFEDYVESLDTSTYYKRVNQLRKELYQQTGLFASCYINNPDSILTFFAKRTNVKAWLNRFNTSFLNEVSDWNSTLDLHGLDSNYYHAAYINHCRKRVFKALAGGKVPNMDTMIAMQLLLADAIYTSPHDISQGRISPKYSLTASLLKVKSGLNAVDVLLNKDLLKGLRKSIPKFKDYKDLQSHLARMKTVPYGSFIKGAKYSNIPKDSLRQVDLLARLIVLDAIHQNDSIFKKPNFGLIRKGLTKLAARHSIRTSLDSFEERLAGILDFNPENWEKKLILNLERWRWTGPTNKGHKVWVNIARNELDAFRNDTLVLNMRVCTGKARAKSFFQKMEKYLNGDSGAARPWGNQETPIIKSNLTHMYVMPNWNIPKSILFNELLGKIRNNPGYIYKLGYRLQTYSGTDVDPYSINWKKITQNNIRVHLVQPGGKRNALGKLKVMFSNPYSVYCHDTPQKWAFSRANRHVSHGCVRLHKPFEFAEYLYSCQDSNRIDKVLLAAGKDPIQDTSLIRLRNLEAKDTTIIEKKYGIKHNKKFNLETRIPIYIVYFTCETNEKGELNFYADGYGRDEYMFEAMKRPRHTLDKRKRKEKKPTPNT